MSHSLIPSKPGLASVLPIRAHIAQMTEGASLWCLTVRKSHSRSPQHPSVIRWVVSLLTATPAQSLGDSPPYQQLNWA